jgi:hypothetical protein
MAVVKPLELYPVAVEEAEEVAAWYAEHDRR